MKVYEYLAEVFANNEIDVEEINSISVIYFKMCSKFDHTSWEVVHKELKMKDNMPINPMHIEEWDDDINNIYRVGDSNDELVMNIGVKLCSGTIFYSLYCEKPRLTPMIQMN